jgi:hypothetical protein
MRDGTCSHIRAITTVKIQEHGKLLNIVGSFFSLRAVQ